MSFSENAPDTLGAVERSGYAASPGHYSGFGVGGGSPISAEGVRRECPGVAPTEAGKMGKSIYLIFNLPANSTEGYSIAGATLHSVRPAKILTEVPLTSSISG